jgi:hypothetical protein
MGRMWEYQTLNKQLVWWVLFLRNQTFMCHFDKILSHNATVINADHPRQLPRGPWKMLMSGSHSRCCDWTQDISSCGDPSGEPTMAQGWGDGPRDTSHRPTTQDLREKQKQHMGGSEVNLLTAVYCRGRQRSHSDMVLASLHVCRRSRLAVLTSAFTVPANSQPPSPKGLHDNSPLFPTMSTLYHLFTVQHNWTFLRL